jgi:acyl-CoA thioesterase-1
VNAGVGGAVTADGVRRLDAVLTNDIRVLVLELGANDGLRGVPTTTIEQNLATIIERAQARGIRVLLCGMETPPTHGWEYTVAFHRVFPSLASRYGVTLVPFLLAGVALNANLNGTDGIHPNTAGAREIAQTVWPYLERVIQETVGATR